MFKRGSILLSVAGAVLLGMPASGEWARHTVDDTFDGADGARLADANGDGLMDIATPFEEGGRIRVYLHPGVEKVRERWPGVTVGAVESPEDAVFVDLDADGAMDVVSCTEGSSKTMFVHWAPKDPAAYIEESAWVTQALPASENKFRWMFCVPMQVDGAHGVDLVAGGKNENAELGWFEAPENPRDLAAWQWHGLLPVGWIMTIAARDMNNDGLMDIVFSDRRGDARGCWWLACPSDVKARRDPWAKFAMGGPDYEVMFMTMEHDGNESAWVASSGGPILEIRRSSAEGSWAAGIIPMPENTGTGKCAAGTDLDGDGIPEVLFTTEHANAKHGVGYFKRAGDSWSFHDIGGMTGTKFDMIEVYDMDQDGDLDLLTCEEHERLGVIWYKNPGATLPTQP